MHVYMNYLNNALVDGRVTIIVRAGPEPKLRTTQLGITKPSTPGFIASTWACKEIKNLIWLIKENKVLQRVF